MLSNEAEGMLPDERMATCVEQSHLDTEYAWNVTPLVMRSLQQRRLSKAAPAKEIH